MVTTVAGRRPGWDRGEAARAVQDCAGADPPDRAGPPAHTRRPRLPRAPGGFDRQRQRRFQGGVVPGRRHHPDVEVRRTRSTPAELAGDVDRPPPSRWRWRRPRPAGRPAPRRARSRFGRTPGTTRRWRPARRRARRAPMSREQCRRRAPSAHQNGARRQGGWPRARRVTGWPRSASSARAPWSRSVRVPKARFTGLGSATRRPRRRRARR